MAHILLGKVCRIRGKHGPFSVAVPSGIRFCKVCGKNVGKEGAKVDGA